MNSGIGPLSMETTAPSGIPITGDEECLKVSDWSNDCMFANSNVDRLDSFDHKTTSLSVFFKSRPN